MAPSSPTDSILVGSVNYLEIKRLDFILLFSFYFELEAARVEGFLGPDPAMRSPCI